MRTQKNDGEIMRNAIAKATIYFYFDGYLTYKNGIAKRIEMDELLSSDEMVLVKPYLNSICKDVKGYPNYNEIPKTNDRKKYIKTNTIG